MSKKIVLGLALASALAACQQQQPQPDVYVPPAPQQEPITQEPVFQGKYG